MVVLLLMYIVMLMPLPARGPVICWYFTRLSLATETHSRYAFIMMMILVSGIMEADDRQVTTSTIGTRQTEYHEALPSSANDEVRCDCSFADDGNAS